MQNNSNICNNLIHLWNSGKIPFYKPELDCDVNKDTSTITPYLINDGKKHAAVLVFPGGGYVHRQEREAEPAARYINSLGLHAFVVNYRVIPYDPYTGCIDGKRAIRYVRAHADEFNILPDHVGVMGFSAGAGISCLATETYDKPEYDTTDETDNFCAKPDFCIFAYGSLSLNPDYMAEKDLELLKKMMSDDQIADYVKARSCDELVRENMPPIFLWHTADDERVKTGAALDFVKKLYEKGNTYEFHIFPEGGHGKAIDDSKNIAGMCQWMPLLENWLDRNGFLV